jgi:hypothetical protein
MSELADNAPPAIRRHNAWTAWARTEDWWAIFIGVGLIVVAVGALAAGIDLKWIAVAPQKWHTLSGAALSTSGQPQRLDRSDSARSLQARAPRSGGRRALLARSKLRPIFSSCPSRKRGATK